MGGVRLGRNPLSLECLPRRWERDGVLILVCFLFVRCREDFQKRTDRVWICCLFQARKPSSFDRRGIFSLARIGSFLADQKPQARRFSRRRSTLILDVVQARPGRAEYASYACVAYMRGERSS